MSAPHPDMPAILFGYEKETHEPTCRVVDYPDNPALLLTMDELQELCNQFTILELSEFTEFVRKALKTARERNQHE